MVSMDTWILSIKALLISAGVIYLAIGIQMHVPVTVDEFRAIWYIFISWLKPPYLYIVINGIILMIVALSRFHQQPAIRSEHLISLKSPPPSDFAYSISAPSEVVVRTVEEVAQMAAEDSCDESEDELVELKPVVLVNGSESDFAMEGIAAGGHEAMEGDDDGEAKDVFVDNSALPFSTMPQEMSSPGLIQLDYRLPAMEKHLIPSSSVHKNPIRATSRLLRSSSRMPAELETLESTWRRITEGASCATPKTHQEEVQHFGRTQPSRNLVRAHVPKSKSFKGRTSNLESLPSFRIQKEPSPSQDELNRRVEEFIKKFNEDMRLERQKSLDQHYKEMINNSGLKTN